MIDVPRFEKGERLSAAKLNTLLAHSRGARPAKGERVNNTESGWVENVTRRGYQSVVPFRAIFDLYDLSKASFKVRGFDMLNNSTNACFALSGIWTNIAAGTAALDTAITIAANTFVYIKLHRATAGQTVTLEKLAASAMTNGDADDELYPLWYVPWLAGSSALDRAGIVDLRLTLHMTGMA